MKEAEQSNLSYISRVHTNASNKTRQNRQIQGTHTVGDTKPILAPIPRKATNRRSESRPEKMKS